MNLTCKAVKTVKAFKQRIRTFLKNSIFGGYFYIQLETGLQRERRETRRPFRRLLHPRKNTGSSVLISFVFWMSSLWKNRKDGTGKINRKTKSYSCSPYVIFNRSHTYQRFTRSDWKETNRWTIWRGCTSGSRSIQQQSELNLGSNRPGGPPSWNKLPRKKVRPERSPKGQGQDSWADSPDKCCSPNRPRTPEPRRRLRCCWPLRPSSGGLCPEF